MFKRFALIFTLLALPSMALAADASASADTVCRTVTVCDTPKAAKKASKRKQLPRKPRPAAVAPQQQHQTVNVTNIINNGPGTGDDRVTVIPGQLRMALLAEVGTTLPDTHLMGLVGLRLKHDDYRIGGQIFVQGGPRGVGAQLLPYAVSTSTFQWHVLDPGLLYGGNGKWDVLLGTGVEFKVASWLWLVADARVSIGLRRGGVAVNTIAQAHTDSKCDDDNGGGNNKNSPPCPGSGNGGGTNGSSDPTVIVVNVPTPPTAPTAPTAPTEPTPTPSAPPTSSGSGGSDNGRVGVQVLGGIVIPF